MFVTILDFRLNKQFDPANLWPILESQAGIVKLGIEVEIRANGA
jgi:hypothetical protein